MNWESIGWQQNLLSSAPSVYRSLLIVAAISIGVFCSAAGECQAQVTVGTSTTTSNATAGGQLARATGSRASDAQFLEYERQLNAMLKTRRDEEKEFVGLVVNQIRLGRIPSKLASTSFEWVRNKRPTTKYPFIYFERVLRLQAERLELEDEIPLFDLSIYSEPTQTQTNAARDFPEPPESDTTSTARRLSIFRLGSFLLDRFGR